uniref:Nuclear autoantigenic sperm protein n=1 Tax=Leptobrachium leishanense TaxID=445787 RepID=A0A8C5WH13_9ANUR
MTEETAATLLPAEPVTAEDVDAPSTSADKTEGEDVDCEAKKLMGAGHRHLVMKDIKSAVSAFQEASGLLAKKYGDTADECADAFFSYGISLLELARMENGVLGNALEGVPEEEEEDENEDPNVPSAANLDEKEREQLREQVYDAMAEKPEEVKEKGGVEAEEKEQVKAAEAGEEQEADKKEDPETDQKEDNGDANMEECETSTEESVKPEEKGNEETPDEASENKDEVAELDVNMDEVTDKITEQGESSKDEAAAGKATEKKEPSKDKAEAAAAGKTTEQGEPSKDEAEAAAGKATEKKEPSKDKAEAAAGKATEKKEPSKDKAEAAAAKTTEQGEPSKEAEAAAGKTTEGKPSKDKAEDAAPEESEEKPKTESEAAEKTEEDSTAKTEETAAKDAGEDKGEETEEPMEGEDGEDSEENEGTEEKETEEDIGNLQLAWEMLDLSKLIFKRKEAKEAQLKAAQAHLKLGEVSVESENYSQAVEDFLACLKIQKEHLEAHDRLLAETHYQLGLAYQYSCKHEEAIPHFTHSIDVIVGRITVLSGKLEATTKPDSELQKEIDELKNLLPDIREKIEDSKEAQKTSVATEMALKETLVGGSSGFSQENGSTSTSTKSSGDCTVPVQNCVSDISHLVRKKRKPEESPIKDSEAKKSKQDLVENGDAVVPTNEEADKVEAEQIPMEMAAVESSA